MVDKWGEDLDCYCSAALQVDNIILTEMEFDVSGWIEVYWIEKEIDIADLDPLTAPLNWTDLADNAIEEELLSEQQHNVLIHPGTGQKVYQAIYQIKMNCSEAFEMDSFPFDRQCLNITTNFNVGKYNFLRARPSWVHKTWGNMDKNQMLKVCMGDKVYRLYQMYDPVIEISDKFYWRLCAERKLAYYANSVGIPTFFILIAVVPVVTIDVSSVADRLAYTTTTFLCMITFQYYCTSLLPKASTRSHMDSYLLTSLILTSIAVLENGAIMFFTKDDGEDTELAKKIDFWFYVVFGFGVIVFHLVIYGLVAQDYFVDSWKTIFECDTGDEPYFPQNGYSTKILKKIDGKYSTVDPSKA